MAPARGKDFARGGAGVPNRLSRLQQLLFAIALAALLGITGTAWAGIGQVGLFRTRELHSANLTSFSKWRDMLLRFERELAACTPDRCRLGEWQQLVASLHGRNAMAQLKLVNKAVNGHRYVEDWAN